MNGHDLLRLNRLQKVVVDQPYAKLASDQSHSETACPVSAFADPIHGVYPCHTKAAALQSAMLAADDGVSDRAVLDSLAKFAAFWDISVEVRDASAKIAATKQSASIDELDDTDFALVADHAGKKIRKFASYDVSSTVAAAEAFYEQRCQFPFAWRKTAAEKLLASASKHGAYLPTFVHDYLLKAACLGRPTEDSVDGALVHRLNLSHTRDSDVMEKLSSLLNHLATDPKAYDSAFISQVLDGVDSVDREIKLASHYEDGSLPLPEEMLVVVKRAKTASTPVRLINGSVIDVSKLTKEALASIDDSLVGMSLAKLAEVLPTLPLPDANLLVRMFPKAAADLGALTDDNFAAQTAPAAMAPPAPAPVMPVAAPGGLATGSKMMDPAAGAMASKMAPVASGAASANFAANGGNVPTNAAEQLASNQKSDAGAGAALGTQHAPLQ